MSFNRLTDLLPLRIRTLIADRNPRSKAALRNILLSLVTKCVTVLISLLLVPMTIHYVNPTQYGIWMTLSSVIAWIAFFDLGLGNGFRNKFAEARAKGDEQLAAEYVSTTYFSVGAIVLAVFVIITVANFFLNWPAILKVEQSYAVELQRVFGIVSGFFCLNMVVNIFSTLLTADQRPGVAAAINGLGQLCSLGVIFILTKTTEGSLTNLALYYSGVPCIVLLITSLIAFRGKRYRPYAPCRRNFRPALIRNILSLGVRFFVIYIAMLVVFQMINIVLSRELGPEAVTRYNIAHRYFNLLYSGSLIFITPFWSAFTDAWHRDDRQWMRNTLHKLEIFCVIVLAAALVMSVISGWFYRIWIGEQVSMEPALTWAVALYTVVMVTGNMYTYLVAGLGTVTIQMIIYVLSALVAWPLIVYSCRLGISGVVLFPTLVYLIQAVFGKIQITKLLNGKAGGLWLK